MSGCCPFSYAEFQAIETLVLGEHLPRVEQSTSGLISFTLVLFLLRRVMQA